MLIGDIRCVSPHIGTRARRSAAVAALWRWSPAGPVRGMRRAATSPPRPAAAVSEVQFLLVPKRKSLIWHVIDCNRHKIWRARAARWGWCRVCRAVEQARLDRIEQARLARDLEEVCAWAEAL